MSNAPCPVCGTIARVTSNGKLYRHGSCDGGGTFVPMRETPLPGDPFTPPHRMPPAVSEARPMTELGQEVAARLKEMFFQYGQRRESDNRNVQETIGPSEVGTPCDRRLAMSLMRVEPSNPGGDGWPAFVGTCVHAGLAEMFLWASGSSGRYRVEVPLHFDNAAMPRGTGDLLDRVMCLFLDHKVMGRWSLDKLRSQGPTHTYRVQVHLYAFAARRSGETVDNVAIIGWPREGSALDDLYVWTEPYSPAIAKDAMERLDRITGQVALDRGALRDLEIASKFKTEDECRYCSFHAPGDDGFTRGCPGNTT